MSKEPTQILTVFGRFRLVFILGPNWVEQRLCAGNKYASGGGAKEL
jgi:hypothetical protein